jgi:hypothetical protein
LPSREAYGWLTHTQQEMAPVWENRVTVESIEKFFEYGPATFLPRVSPTPLLLIVAAEDTMAPADVAITAFEQAHQPKSWSFFPAATSRRIPCRGSNTRGLLRSGSRSTSCRDSREN